MNAVAAIISANAAVAIQRPPALGLPPATPTDAAAPTPEPSRSPPSDGSGSVGVKLADGSTLMAAQEAGNDKTILSEDEKREVAELKNGMRRFVSTNEPTRAPAANLRARRLFPMSAALTVAPTR